MKPTPDITEFRKIIGRNISVLRSMKKLSQVQLGKALGYSSTGTISQVEAGERGLQLASIMQVADFFDVHPAFLITKVNSDNFNDFKLISKIIQLVELRHEQPEVAKPLFAAINFLLDTLPPFGKSPPDRNEEIG
jgi:transcriptional regulator with XRE-family HTH domain